MTLPCILLLCLSAVEITVAPDQPMPFVYYDDPLILEVHSERDMHVSGTLRFTSAYSGEETVIDVTPFFVHGGTDYWYAVQEAPRERGCFQIDMDLQSNEDLFQDTARFCRIDRPAELRHIPVYAHCGGDIQRAALTALRSIGIETIRSYAGNEHLPELTNDAAALGLNVILGLSSNQLKQMPEYLTPIIEERCEYILRFDVSCEGYEAECGPLTESLKEAGCPASVSLVVPGAGTFSQVMQQSPNLSIRHITLEADRFPAPDEVQRILYIAAQYGLEGTQVHVVNPGWYPRTPEQIPQFLHHFLNYRSFGASHVGLNASIIADEMDIQYMMAYLNGLSLHFSGQVYVGDCLNDAAVMAPLFRAGANWLAVLWSENRRNTVVLPVDGAINLAITDAFGNTLSLPESIQDGIEIYTDAAPVYVTGTGGTLPGRAAMNQLRTQTHFFLAQADLQEYLPQNLIDLLQKIEAEPRSAGSRLRFLELLRSLPWLEEQWHGRQLTKHIAVPAIMQISDIAKTMAVIEEDRGELFLEPLSDTLARVEELQSLYLTGSAGTAKSRERGDWILTEVRRLVEMAEMMDRAERKIEAGAIAGLAEARAECLRSASRAESPQETPSIVPLPVTPVEDVSPEDGEVDESAEMPDEPVEDDPEVDTDEAPEARSEIIHVVVSGDNAFSIARKHNVSLDDLLEWNELTRSSILRIGQELVVRVNADD